MTPEPSRSIRVRRFIRQLHRWLGLLIAAQVLMWIGGGLIMSSLRLEEVRGEHLVARQAPRFVDAQAELVPIGTVLASHAQGKVRSITLGTLLGRPVYRVELEAGTELVDARSGQALSPLPAADAEAIARADYAGEGRLLGVEWVVTPALEYRERELPLWRVRFDDERGTTLYISPKTGQVVARRNDLWRLFDFVWMLHIMDYQEREDFNHPLLVVAAASALLFVLSGLVMLGYSFAPRRGR